MCHILKYALVYGGVFSNISIFAKNRRIKNMNGYIARNIDNVLLKWKNGNRRKPLLIRGARQVGKSSAVKHLGETFENYVEVNLELQKNLSTIFDLDLDPKRICFELGAALGAKITPGNTLLFIDEIQVSTNAIKSLWFFKERYPDLHVVAAGSLLEFALADLESFGVGRIRSLYLYPLSFDEFLRAQGLDNLCEAKSQCSPERPITEVLHENLCQQIRYYYMIGGMPESVKIWVETHDYEECREVQSDIIDAYFDDFRKYRPNIDPDLLRSTLLSVPMQIGSKFKYSNISGDVDTYNAKKALDALIKAGLIVPVTHTAANGCPLGSEENKKFRKFIFIDTALMLHMQRMSITDILTATPDELVNKGNVAEMFVGLELLKYSEPNLKPYLFYWQGDAEASVDENGRVVKSQAEVDYIINSGNTVLPIEVKAGKRGSMQSLYQLLKKRPQMPFGIRCALENFSSFENVKVYPLYAISNLRSIQ